MLQCEQYNPDTGGIERIAREQVGASLACPDYLLWIDLESPTEDELHWLADTFAFHPLAMEDVRHQQQRAKVDQYEHYFFVVTHTVHYRPKTQRVDSHEIDIFLGKNFLVTVHTLPAPVLAETRRRWNEAHTLRRDVSFLFYLVLDAITDSFFPVVDEIGDVIDEIDEVVIARPQQSSLRRIFALRRSLLIIRRVLGPMRDALNELLRSDEYGDFATSSEQHRTYLNDVFDHILRLADFVDTYRDMLSGSLEAYQSSLSNQLNENMQRLTIGATILATATVITGFFGMNLHGLMINSPWPYGGHTVFIVMVVIMAIELWLFRRKGWI